MKKTQKSQPIKEQPIQNVEIFDRMAELHKLKATEPEWKSIQDKLQELTSSNGETFKFKKGELTTKESRQQLYNKMAASGVKLQDFLQLTELPKDYVTKAGSIFEESKFSKEEKKTEKPIKKEELTTMNQDIKLENMQDSIYRIEYRIEQLLKERHHFEDKDDHSNQVAEMLSDNQGMFKILQEGAEGILKDNLLKSSVEAQRVLPQQFAKSQAGIPLNEKDVVKVVSQIEHLANNNDPKKRFIGTRGNKTLMRAVERGRQFKEDEQADREFGYETPQTQVQRNITNGDFRSINQTGIYNTSIQGAQPNPNNPPKQVYNINTGVQEYKGYSRMSIPIEKIVEEKKVLHKEIKEKLKEAPLSYKHKAKIEDMLDMQNDRVKNMGGPKTIHEANDLLMKELNVEGRTQEQKDLIWKNYNEYIKIFRNPMQQAHEGKQSQFPATASNLQLNKLRTQIGQQVDKQTEIMIQPKKSVAENGQSNRPNPPGQGQVNQLVNNRQDSISHVLSLDELWNAVYDAEIQTHQTNAQSALMNNIFLEGASGNIQSMYDNLEGADFWDVNQEMRANENLNIAIGQRQEKQNRKAVARHYSDIEKASIEAHTKAIEERLYKSADFYPLGANELKNINKGAYNTLAGTQKQLMEKDLPITGHKINQEKTYMVGTGSYTIKNIVELVYDTANYISKISGDIDPDKKKLKDYKTKTEVFNPLIAKKESTQFNVTAQSAFKTRRC